MIWHKKSFIDVIRAKGKIKTRTDYEISINDVPDKYLSLFMNNYPGDEIKIEGEKYISEGLSNPEGNTDDIVIKFHKIE